MSDSLFLVKEHIIDAAHIREYARATSISQDEVLKLHIKQYVPKDNQSPRKGDVTIIGAHANGFPKELYEPLWDDFYRDCVSKGVRIRAIWIADCAWENQSGRLNLQAGKLGNDPSWYDYGRDILQMINTFRMPRPIMGIGHSFGACALTELSLSHPRLFTSLVLLDPVLTVPRTTGGSAAQLSAIRRDTWPSRAVATELFQRSPFYQTWDKRAFNNWVQYGLRSADPSQPDGPVVLSTVKDQEVFTFIRPTFDAFDEEGKEIVRQDRVPEGARWERSPFVLYPYYRPEPCVTYEKLDHIRPGVLYVVGGKSDLVDKDIVQQRTLKTGSGYGGSGGTKCGRVKEVEVAHAGHLVPMEAPGESAQHAANWVKAELEHWWVEEREYEEWARGSEQDRTLLSDRVKRKVGIRERPPKPKM